MKYLLTLFFTFYSKDLFYEDFRYNICRNTSFFSQILVCIDQIYFGESKIRQAIPVSAEIQNQNLKTKIYDFD